MTAAQRHRYEQRSPAKTVVCKRSCSPPAVGEAAAKAMLQEEKASEAILFAATRSIRSEFVATV